MNEERRRNPAHENLNQAIFRSDGVIIMRMGVRGGGIVGETGTGGYLSHDPATVLPNPPLNSARCDV